VGGLQSFCRKDFFVEGIRSRLDEMPFCLTESDDFVKSRQGERHSKKLQMQGAPFDKLRVNSLRNEACIEVRCKPAPAKAGERCLPASGGGSATPQMDFCEAVAFGRKTNSFEGRRNNEQRKL
jgi:hypothetical protein